MASSPSPGTTCQYVLVVAHGDTVTLEDANRISPALDEPRLLRFQTGHRVRLGAQRFEE